MVNSSQGWGRRLGLVAWAMSGAIPLGIALLHDFSGNRAFAQVTSDNKLNTQVTPNGNVYEIRDGTPVPRSDGTVNLFHSFGSFSVPNEWTAQFLNEANVANIFGRVTGGTPSDIQGIIKAQGQANLFLINPSGIIFGKDARLDIGGSFVGTTANAIRFPGGGEFSMNSGVTPGDSVLAVNPSALFFNQTPAGVRVNQSTVGLQVKPGQNLFLVGGEVQLNGGTVRAQGGRIELGGLAEAGQVKIEELTTGSNPNLNFPDVGLTFPDGVTRADVSLTNGAIVDVVALGGGNIAINAQKINVSGGSLVCAGIGTVGSSCNTPPSSFRTDKAQAGNIVLSATDTVNITQSRIENNVNPGATGNPDNIFEAINKNTLFGSILIEAGSLSTDNARISTSTFGTGSAGLVFIKATDSVVLTNNSVIDSAVAASGQGGAGGVLIEAGSLSTDNARVTTSIFGTGNAGLISIKASDSVVLTNNSVIDSAVAATGKGDAGGIVIDAGSISISNATTLTTETSGQGNGGLTYLRTSGDISITGSGTLVSSNVEQGATGETLGIRVDARSLFMSEGAELQVLTRGNGSAGKILVNASDLVDLRGVSSTGGFSTGLLTSTEGNATGDGGLIEVNAGTLRLSDAAVLSARTQTAGTGGGILVNVDTLELLNGGQILATAFSSGSSGAIIVNAKDKITLSGRDPTYIDRILQIFNNYVAQFGVDEAVKLTLQTFDNVPPGSSGIFANVLSGSTGAAGGILITTKDLFIRDGATISVDNPGPREAGDIIILGRDLIMKNQGTINARATSGQGGNIVLLPDTFLVLLQNSRISTTSGFQGKGGDGGNVRIIDQYTIAAPFNDNNINANAFTGTGGNIGIRANRLYDIEERNDVSRSNDIDPSSDFGVDGIVTSNILNVDPTQGLANLPANPVDPSTLIAETCAPRGGIAERQRNRFIVTGRGGLPPDPNAAFPGEAVVNDLGTPSEGETNTTDDPNSTNPTSPAPTATASPQEPEIAQAAATAPQEPEIAPATSASPKESEMVEAQGWVYGENGDIIFTARPSNGTVTPNNPALTPASTCNVSSTLPQ